MESHYYAIALYFRYVLYIKGISWILENSTFVRLTDLDAIYKEHSDDWIDLDRFDNENS